MDEYERGLRDGLALAMRHADGYTERWGLRGDARMHMTAFRDELEEGVTLCDIKEASDDHH
jgi:hypothetical protein